ncbi:MAG: 4Fe-4S dicluster domain-containing protein [Spirochaetota bacterium]
MSDIQNFQEEKKSHWQSYEAEKNEDRKKELQDREFFPPPESMFQKLKTENVNRKSFLKFMGASVAMSTLNCVRKPVEKIVPYVDAPMEVKHGHSLHYASVCKGCEAGCGTLVRTKDGRPIKMEGNPEHPQNQGALCSSGQAAIFDLYDPDRSKEPLAVKAGKGSKTTWKDLDAAVKKSIAENQGKTVILTSPLASPSTKEIIQGFLSATGGGKVYEYKTIGAEESIALANKKSYGKAVVPNYRFDRAKVIVSIDADFLGTWISSTEFSKQFSTRRTIKSDTGEINKYIAIESIPTVTGSNADLRIPVRPGDQRIAAFALAAALKELGAKIPASVSDDVATLCKKAGISEEAVKNTAQALWGAKGASLVVAGGTSARTKDMVDLQIAANMLNSVLGNNGKTIDFSATRSTSAADYSANVKQLKADLEAGNVGTLILAGVNPVYDQPTAKWDALLKKAGLVVSMADRLDETAAHSGWLANTSHFLENWGDMEAVKGIVSLQQPMIQPLFNSRSLEDHFIQWAGGEIKGSKTFYEFFRAKYKSKLGGDAAFNEAVKLGLLPGSKINAGGSGASFSASSVQPLQEQPAGAMLALYESVGVGDGHLANNSLRQELPDPISKVTWDNYIAISPKFAEKLGATSNDVLKVTASGKSLELPMQIQPGMHNEAVGIAIGYGRTHVGKVGNGVGLNTYALATFSEDGTMLYGGLPVKLEKTRKTYKLATTQDHHMMNPTAIPGKKSPQGLYKPYDKDRPLIQSTTFAEWQKNPSAGIATPEIPKILDGSGKKKKIHSRGLNPEFKYTGHKWGMSIDLTLCTGCGACVVACQVDNNIPSVGRDEVRVGREMHWIRIDRYYIGDPEKPETMEMAHQPVMCQHCDDAPCETVCPVSATMHGSEGTNDMVYNRCVGTRYCSNNCPYKVRRFNWMNHWNGTDATRAPQYLGFNPDVTVRSRGVMEKCTFCASKIAASKIKAENEGRELLRDGEVQTACQQTCACNAISFGNTNDPEAEVSQNRKDKRSYHILEYLNVKPQVTYLSRVRNTI